MKKLIATLLSLILLASVFTSTAFAAAEKFTDVKPGAWYYTAVHYAAGEKLFNGTSATTFAPNEAMTRGMFVTVLGNKAKLHSLSETFLI